MRLWILAVFVALLTFGLEGRARANEKDIEEAAQQWIEERLQKENYQFVWGQKHLKRRLALEKRSTVFLKQELARKKRERYLRARMDIAEEKRLQTAAALKALEEKKKLRSRKRTKSPNTIFFEKLFNKQLAL